MHITISAICVGTLLIYESMKTVYPHTHTKQYSEVDIYYVVVFLLLINDLYL